MMSERMKRRIERLLDQADDAAEAHDWFRVRESAEAVLAVDAGNADATGFIDMADRAASVSGNEAQSTRTATDLETTPAELSTETPTSFANSRYKVRKFLREGGKQPGDQAHDTLPDREVALTLVNTQGL